MRVKSFLPTLVLFASTMLLATTVPAIAAMPTDSDVVISEIHYKPVGQADEEFVELTNTGTESVDISEWCFTDGFDFCFPAETPPLAAGDRVIVTGSLADFSARHGFAADHQIMSGAISNGGETIELSNAVPEVIDTVTYDDEGLWPGAPDGNGPSLELTDLTADNSDPAVWGASLVDDGTPGAVNTINGGIPGAEISDVSVTPFRPNPNETIQVDATVAGATSVSLEYVVNFDAPQTIAMSDLGSDAYTATIPGQTAGDLVRYKIITSNGVDLVTDPSVTDTINYHGIVVVDPALSSVAPIIEWFMSDVDYDDMLDNHRFDDVQLPAVISHDGVVIDNALVRVRGNTSRSLDRPNLKWEMPDGHLFHIPGKMDYPVDEFNMQLHGNAEISVAWGLGAEAGNPEVEMFPIYTDRNGEFWGIGSYLESLDGRWRNDNGYDDGAFYKPVVAANLQARETPLVLEMYYEKKTRTDEDFTDLWELTQAVDAAASDEQLAYLLDNVDISSVVNYMAIRLVTRHYDQFTTNYRIYRDTDGTGRWELLLWDLDKIFDPQDLHPVMISPEDHGLKLELALIDYPEFKAMMYRRLRTLADEYLEGDVLLNRFDALHVGLEEELDITFDLYGSGKDAAGQRQSFIDGVDYRRSLFASHTRQSGFPPSNSRPIPTSQTSDRPIVISELHFDDAGAGVQFIELSNTSTIESFDLTGWAIDGVDLVIPPGTVILPESQAIFVADDAGFRAFFEPTLIGGVFDGELGSAGALIELFDANGALVDAVDYRVRAPWPTPTGGATLSLRDPLLDNAVPANWGVSLVAGGTPGLANVLDPDPPIVAAADGVVLLNEWNAVSSSKMLKNDGTDTTFGAIAGNGGDWFELVVADDGLDLAGWELQWSETDGPSSGTLTLADDPLWASLPAGAIITVSEDQVDDVSFNPAGGDWTINVQAPGAYVSGSFDVTNDDWQLTIVDGDGNVSFGPAGEGISTGGVGSTEVGALLDDPLNTSIPTSDYDDLGSSSWGLPNSNGNGGQQDFSVVRNEIGPTIASGPSDLSTFAGETVALTVEADGTVPLTYEWRRDSVPIADSDSPTLTLVNVGLADDGAVFDVFVTNLFGSVTSGGATLSVAAFAPITVEGDPTVTVSEGVEQLDVSWAAVDGATQYQLRYNPVGGSRVWDGPTTDMTRLLTDLEGGVSHRVQVRAFVGTWGPFTTVFATPLEVAAGPVAPSFVSDPVDVTVIEGAAASFDVVVAGDPVPSLQWRRDGVDLAGETGSTLSLATTVLADDGAVFDVVATNSAGTATSAGATLTVETAPDPIAPSVVSDPVDVTVIEGAAASFDVVVAGDPVPSLQWRRDGVDLAGETGSTLSLATTVLADDGAVFDVVATNVAGVATSGGAALTVEEFVAGPGITVEGDPTVTVVEGARQLDVSWTSVDGATLYQLRYQPLGESRIWTSPSTDMARVLSDLAGGLSHKVQVRALVGSWGSWTTVNATPLVEAPGDPVAPSFVGDPVDATVIEGGSVSFTVEVSGEPVPSLQWRRDGVDVPGETGTTLTVATAALADDGAVFDIVATNVAGSTTSAGATLTVEEFMAGEGITVAGDPTVTVVEGVGELDVSWTSVDGATLYQLRYQPTGESRVWTPPATDMARTLTGLASGLSHKVQVRALVGSWGSWTTVIATPS